MLTEQEINSINLGLTNINASIQRITQIISILHDKKNLISSILNTRYSQENLDYDSKFTILCKCKHKLDDLSEKYSRLPMVTSNISDQYKTFLQSEIMLYNPQNKHLIDDSSTRQILNFINKQTTNIPNISPSDSHVIECLHFLPEQYDSYTNELSNLYTKIFIFNQISGIDGNIVMVGANGSGKSTFARQLNGKLANNIVILSAQHFLYYSKRQNISATGNEIKKVRDFQHNMKLGSDSNFTQIMTSDMNDLVNALVSEYADCAFDYYENNNRKQSYLSQTITLWHSIIEHRYLESTRTGLNVFGENISNYEFNQLSDGEKAVFYYIGHILLAQPNSYIIIDEPENHLHLTICNKLWDILEQQRPDCKFIYLTHNLNFATTRTNCTILWNKSFIPPSNWKFEILPENDIIPEVMIMELVGSRKNICFCEGNNQSSIDYKLYSVLFPQFTLIPVSGHRDVIDYVNSYNSTSSFITKALGIIDGDYHHPEQIGKWKQNNIFTLPINEIENVLCDDYILSFAIERFCAPNNALDNFHTAFWQLLQNTREQLASTYVNNLINEQFKENFLHEKNNIESIISELNTITSPDQIKSIYEQTLSKIDIFISTKNYNDAIRFVNFKGRLTKDIAKKTIIDKYENRVLDLIKKECSLQDYIKQTYFADFFK